MKRVLILDASQRSALAVTRSLGQQGIQVITAEEKPTALAGHSKFSKQYFEYPSPRINPEQFISALSHLVNEQHIEVLLPMTELTSTLLLSHKALFPNTAIPFPEMDVVESLANKCLLMQTAESLNIPTPHTWYASDPKTLPCNIEELSYPVVLKPGKSWLFHKGQWQRATVQFAANAADAKKILNSDWAFSAHSFMIQEYVEGYGAGVFAIYDNGTPLALFAHQRLREKPPSGGVSVLSESIPVDPMLGEHAQTLLKNANWHGVAMVEFKVAPDGTPYLMEINTRFWGSLQLAVDAKVDFPYMLYKLACGEQAKPVTHYKTGIRLRWLMGDLDNLYLTLKNKNNSFKTKTLSLMRFIMPSRQPTKHEINRLNDLKPFLHEAHQYLYDIFGLKPGQ